MIANLINIGIFAFMMGFIEVFPNLLAVFFRSSNSSAGMNSTTTMTLGGEGETSGEEIQTQVGEGGGDAWRDEVGDQVEALDSTFYYVLFTLSVLAAALGQFLVNHELQGLLLLPRLNFTLILLWIPGPLRVNRVTDLLLVVVITVLPLALLPAIMPYRVCNRIFKVLFSYFTFSDWGGHLDWRGNWEVREDAFRSPQPSNHSPGEWDNPDHLAMVPTTRPKCMFLHIGITSFEAGFRNLHICLFQLCCVVYFLWRVDIHEDFLWWLIWVQLSGLGPGTLSGQNLQIGIGCRGMIF